MNEQKTKIEPRQHHYLSKSYLKFFTATGTLKDKLCVYNVRQRKVYSAIPEKVARQRDYFRIEPADSGLDPTQFEKDLAVAEGQFEQVTSLIMERDTIPPPGVDLEIILGGMARLALASPQLREGLRVITEDYLAKKFKESVTTEERYEALLANIGMTNQSNLPSREQFQKYILDTENYDIKFKNEFFIYHTLLQMEPYVDLFRSKVWTLQKPVQPSQFFVTCDKPIKFLPTSQEQIRKSGRPRFNELSGFAILFPLTKSHLLVGEPNFGQSPQTILLRPEKVATVNSLSIADAGEIVVSPYDNMSLMVKGRVISQQFQEGTCNFVLSENDFAPVLVKTKHAMAQQRLDRLRKERR